MNDTEIDGFVVPNMQSWFRQNSFICTPDNGILYHSRIDVNYIAPLVVGRMPKVRIINARSTLKSLACATDWSEQRLYATYDDDNCIMVWDLDKEAPIKGHKGHVYKLKSHHESRAGGSIQNHDVTSAICFTETQKVISVDRSVMIIYCLITDTYKTFADFFKPNSTVVLLSPCPVDRYVFAAGMKDGLIQIFSIRDDMKILFSMRGHDKEIVSIEWMQVAVHSDQSQVSWRRQERPKKEARKKKKSVTETETPKKSADTSDIFDIYSYDDNAEEFGTIIDKQTSSYDQKDHFHDKVHTTEGFNFLEECKSLKEDILKAKQDKDNAEDSAPDDAEEPQDINTDDENELDEAEKLRDYIIVDDTGKEKQKSSSEDEHEEQPVAEDTVTRLLLASGSRENVIYVWDYETGVVVDKIVLHSHAQTSKRLYAGTFITPCWVSPSKIVANTAAGHMFEWSVSFFFQGTRIRMSARQHLTRYPIDMVIGIVRAKGSIAGYDPNADYVWCQSINRKIYGVCLGDALLIAAEFSCLATGNTCIVENPLEPFIIAVGCTDKKIITLGLPTMSYNDVHCVQFMIKISSKVTTLDWHPEKENFLAFGTSEGRIGLLDTNSANNVPTLLNSFLSTDVYTLKWSELVDEYYQKSTVLFAAGKSKLAYYKMMGSAKHDPIELRQFGMVSSVASVKNYLFVGTQDGFVYISDLHNNFAQLFHRNIARRYICSMQFKNNILVVAANENNIRLIDFTNGFDDQIDDKIRLLEGHTAGVCCLRWGHGDSTLLVSGSFDKTVRVWDSTTCSCIAAYHSVDSVFSAIFSPIHENIIILTGKGVTLSFIDYTKYLVGKDSITKENKPSIKWAVGENRIDKKAARDKKRAGKPIEQLHKAIAGLQVSDEPSKELPICDEEKKPIKIEPAVEEVVESFKEIKIKEVKPTLLKSNIPTTFHLTNREINKPSDVLACIVKLTKFIEPEDEELEEAAQENSAEENKEATSHQGPAVVKDEPKTDERPYFNEKLFTTEDALRDLIDEETKNHHVYHTASIGTILLPQIGFRLKEEITARMAANALTDQLVALAPSISHVFWRKCCEVYAYQLLEKQYTLASIPYFLASHKIDEAIESLCKHKYFREAWVICRLRKAVDDPIREKVFADWAQYLENVGNLEGAGLVWTAAKNYKNAIAVLSKRRDQTEEIQCALEALNHKILEANP